MIFAIDRESARLVARRTDGSAVETYECTAQVCGNPACQCRTTTVVMRPQSPGLGVQTVAIALDTHGIDGLFRKRAKITAAHRYAQLPSRTVYDLCH